MISYEASFYCVLTMLFVSVKNLVIISVTSAFVTWQWEFWLMPLMHPVLAELARYTRPRLGRLV